MELAIPLVRQTKGWSCGPASLAAILRYYGHKGIGERALIKRAGCTTEGSTIRGLAAAASSYGITPCWTWQGVTYETLCRISELGNPVMASVQAWHPVRPHDYSDEWADGHWVVVTYADAEGVRCMDPSMPGARAWVDRDSWLERWHDIDVDDRRVVHPLIVFPAATIRRRRFGRVKEMG